MIALTGYKSSLFENVGKVSIAFTLLDEKKMMELMISLNGDLKVKDQRKLKKKAMEAMIENYETYRVLI